MARELNRLTILNAIFSHFQMATQWPDEIATANYFAKAEALVELLEVVDCGSVGGYDKKNPHKRVTGCEVYDRFLTLLNKEKDRANIKPQCNATVDTLQTYFTELMALRSKVYGTA